MVILMMMIMMTVLKMKVKDVRLGMPNLLPFLIWGSGNLLKFNSEVRSFISQKVVF